ncbi:thiol S-methyltransferase METTL7B-like [Mya arenaria]|uniref:thiol S-methyltransferase METTL7B-like n=1 Tax=Mya arenaria TaxID=6604 RepID=UPI0022E549EC|nr:thiol S-methyltransferase METTL7B-like [Mya arenaria]
MSAEDAVVQNFLIYKIGSAVVIASAMWLFRKRIKYHTQQRMFAWFMDRVTNRMNRGLYKYKTEVFQYVHKHKRDVNHDLKVLEVGAGTAANLQFLPDNTSLTCLDPNPHFVGYIKSNLKKNDKVVEAEIVTGFAENMPFEDKQFDVVICTLVLCSVKDVDDCLKEIKRVLVKGGIFVSVEHVADKEKSLTWYVQGIANPFHRWLGDGCEARRNTRNNIEKAGFSEVVLENIRPKSLPFWIRPCIMGYARK